MYMYIKIVITVISLLSPQVAYFFPSIIEAALQRGGLLREGMGGGGGGGLILNIYQKFVFLFDSFLCQDRILIKVQ